MIILLFIKKVAYLTGFYFLEQQSRTNLTKMTMEMGEDTGALIICLLNPFHH